MLTNSAFKLWYSFKWHLFLALSFSCSSFVRIFSVWSVSFQFFFQASYRWNKYWHGCWCHCKTYDLLRALFSFFNRKVSCVQHGDSSVRKLNKVAITNKCTSCSVTQVHAFWSSDSDYESPVTKENAVITSDYRLCTYIYWLLVREHAWAPRVFYDRSETLVQCNGESRSPICMKF